MTHDLLGYWYRDAACRNDDNLTYIGPSIQARLAAETLALLDDDPHTQQLLRDLYDAAGISSHAETKSQQLARQKVALRRCNGDPDAGIPACPVRDACLRKALSQPTTAVGVWGGTTERQRRGAKLADIDRFHTDTDEQPPGRSPTSEPAGD